jgi:hypothetical protein
MASPLKFPNVPQNRWRRTRGYFPAKVIEMANFFHRSLRFTLLPMLSAVIVLAATSCLFSGPLIPGTGTREQRVGDDFEQADWTYTPNLPKSSRETDQQERRPFGYSANQRWIEGPHRGTPDLLRRVATPEGGLPGSQGALLIRTLHSGVPGRLSYSGQQDDLIVQTTQRVGGYLPVARSPSVVVRVFIPPFDQWENRSGSSFGFRADLRGRKRYGGLEQYWPGMFLQFNSQSDPRHQQDSAFLILRAQQSGHDFRGPDITETGWWTFGMSFTPDGQVHYFASPGVDDLTPQDHLASRLCYGFHAERFHTFFFNVLSKDDGRSWSTPWIIDDPALYLASPTTQVTRRPTGQPKQ